MRYRPKEIAYPTRLVEYQIVTPSGVVSRIFENAELAYEHAKTIPLGWKLVECIIVKHDITERLRLVA